MNIRRLSVTLAVLGLVFAPISQVRAQSSGTAYNLNPALCDVIKYPYATYVWCDDMGTDAPGMANASVFLEALPDGTLAVNSNIQFCTISDSSPYCTYVDEPLTGTLTDLQLHGSFAGQFNGTVAFTITAHVNRLRRINYIEAGGVLTVQ